MELKFFKPKYNKCRLKKIALEIALAELVMNKDYNSITQCRKKIMTEAKKEYNKKHRKEL